MGKLEIITEISKLYSFHYEFDAKVVIGESIVPIESAEIREIISQLSGNDKYVPDVNNDLLSLVVIDSNEEKAILFRNLTNSRPVFYHAGEDVLYVSTHMRLLKKYGAPMVPDDSVLPEYYTYRILVAPRTFCRDVYRLSGGELKVLDLSGGRVLVNRFMKFSRRPYEGSFEHSEISAKINSMLHNSIKGAFEPYSSRGVLLSGGADSSLLAALGVKIDDSISSVSTSFFLHKPG